MSESDLQFIEQIFNTVFQYYKYYTVLINISSSLSVYGNEISPPSPRTRPPSPLPLSQFPHVLSFDHWTACRSAPTLIIMASELAFILADNWACYEIWRRVRFKSIKTIFEKIIRQKMFIPDPFHWCSIHHQTDHPIKFYLAHYNVPKIISGGPTLSSVFWNVNIIRHSNPFQKNGCFRCSNSYSCLSRSFCQLLVLVGFQNFGKWHTPFLLTSAPSIERRQAIKKKHFLVFAILMSKEVFM